MQIPDHATILFQGDSITDAGRNRNNPYDLGHGYAFLTAAWFNATYPQKHVKFINRGISGNHASDLQARWQEDCLALHPDVLSILVGVNDTLHRFEHERVTTAAEFEQSYSDILHRARDAGIGNIILMEPFVLLTDRDWNWSSFLEDLAPKQQIVRKLAREYHATYIPLDGIFAAESVRREPGFWAADGIHPTPAGAARIAQAWLQAVSLPS